MPELSRVLALGVSCSENPHRNGHVLPLLLWSLLLWGFEDSPVWETLCDVPFSWFLFSLRSQSCVPEGRETLKPELYPWSSGTAEKLTQPTESQFIQLGKILFISSRTQCCKRDLGLQSTFPCNFSCVCIHTCFAITYVHRDEIFISNIFYNHSPLYILNLKRNNSASLVSQLAFDTPHLYFLSPGDPGRPPWPHPDEKLWSGDLNSGPTLHPLTHPPSTDPHSLML